MSNVLAVDVGGTSSRAVILDRTGRYLAYGRGLAGNPISAGPEQAAAAISAAARAAVAAMPASSGPGSAAGTTVIALAGGRTHASTDWIATELTAIGVAGPVTVESDLLAMFCSSGSELDGYAVVAGTGAGAVRVERGGVVGTADGLGWLLGDDGSGFWIGQRVVREALLALDHRAPPTALADLLLVELGIPYTTEMANDGRRASLVDAVGMLYRMRPVQLAQFAPLAFAGAATGDAAAARILRDAERAIVHTLAAVMTKAVRGPIVLGGGVLARMPELPRRIEAAFATAEDVVDLRRVDDGAVGAAVLALRAASVAVSPATFVRIVETLAPLRDAETA